jgi:alcohol dehydrogenase class IV
MAPARKRSWNPPEGTADLALLDPELSRSCPWRVSRDSALDALSHALESLWNRRADHTSRGQARQAARRILHELPALRERPHDLNLRTRMAHASLLAGLAMARTQTALAHALSYELTLQEGVSHGEACAIWLPMVMELAAERSPRVRADLEVVFEMPVAQALPWFGHWLADLGVQVRDLRAQPAGSAHLAQALASERGSNFIEVGA